MPGVLWKKFDSKTIASNLAFIGSIKDDILDVEELAMNLLDVILICKAGIVVHFTTPKSVKGIKHNSTLPRISRSSMQPT